MNALVEDPLELVAHHLKWERESRGWTIAELAGRSGVSKAMISKIERCDVSPTAALLGKLSGAFGLPLSTLLARAENSGKRLVRYSEQPVWKDPQTGYVRRSVSPPAGEPLELIDVELPPRTRVQFPASAYTFLHQQIWVGSGTLHFSEGEAVHVLRPGDCLQLGPPEDCTFHNRADTPCRYLVALYRR